MGAEGRGFAGLAGAGLAFALTLAGCAAHLSEEDCRGGDWARVGTNDGLGGRPTTALQRHTSDCAKYGVQPDAAAWQRGYERGLQAFCVPEAGYDLGRRGVDDGDICHGSPTYAAFLESYAHGLEERLRRGQMEVDSLRVGATSGNNSPGLLQRAADVQVENERTRALLGLAERRRSAP